MALPPVSDFVGSTVTEAQFKTAMTDLITYLAGIDYDSIGAPTGAVMAFALSTAPDGWLECDGSEVLRSSYGTLYTAIGDTFGAGDGSTTFNLPDLRGEFIRGLDVAGVNDPDARTLGSNQAAAFESHDHGSTGGAGAHSHGTNVFASGAGSPGTVAGTDTTSSEISTDSVGGHSHSTSAVGGDETRPRNVALMYCIKS